MTDYPDSFWERPQAAEDVARAMTKEFHTKLPSGTVAGPLFEDQMLLPTVKESLTAQSVGPLFTSDCESDASIMPASPVVTKVNIVQKVDGKLTSTVLDRKDLEAWMTERGCRQTGIKPARSGRYQIREQLIGQPVFSGFLGPMHEEIKGEVAIRYEDNEAYRTLSI